MNEEAIKKLVSIYADLETQLLDEIVSHFKLNEEFINSDYFRVEKLKELGLLNQNIVNYIADVTKKTPGEIQTALNKIGFEALNLNNLNEKYQGGMLNVDPNTLIENNVVENLIKQSYNELNDRFLEISSKVKNATRDAYLEVMEKTYLQTLGGKTYQEALRNALLDLGNKGITTLTYQTTDKDGNIIGIRNYDVEGAVRRELVTATHNLTNNINKEVAEDLEVEYMLISEHLACRPTHFPWQGTIVKRTELEEVTGLGEVDGMGGPNCKHYATPYFGDARGSELKEISKEDAEKQYELAQKQRYLERGVRKWKRRERIFEKSEDKEYANKCKSKVSEWQKRARSFTEENGLIRSYSRENVEKVSTNNNSSGIIINREKSKNQGTTYAVSQEEINKICNNELKNIKFPTNPTVNSKLRVSYGQTKYERYSWGEVKEIKSIEIGNQGKDTKEFLIDTLLHEKLEAKILITNTEFYKKLDSISTAKRHEYINSVITRYFRMKGWNNDNR